MHVTRRNPLECVASDRSLRDHVCPLASIDPPDYVQVAEGLDRAEVHLHPGFVAVEEAVNRRDGRVIDVGRIVPLQRHNLVRELRCRWHGLGLDVRSHGAPVELDRLAVVHRADGSHDVFVARRRARRADRRALAVAVHEDRRPIALPADGRSCRRLGAHALGLDLRHVLREVEGHAVRWAYGRSSIASARRDEEQCRQARPPDVPPHNSLLRWLE